MNRRTATAASAALATLAAVCACTSTDDASTSTADTTTTTDTTTESSAAPTTSSPDEPIDMQPIPEGATLEPGTYAMRFLFDHGPTRAIVDVPEGYVAPFGGSVIGSERGDMAFWGKVTQVDTDPCGGGKHVSAGTSVRDLAAALVAQRNMRVSQPIPVTIGGYHGVYLKSTAPANIDRCRGGTVTIYGTKGSWLRLDVPSATFREWILNVNGQRVVGGARSGPDAADSAGLAAMVESAEFTDVE